MVANGTNGLKPRCALRIGVVGNRKIDAGVRPEVEATSAKIWRAILETIEKILDEKTRSLFSDELPRVAVLSSLAAGGDQIGAQAALDIGGPLKNKFCVELELMLPFGKDHYPGPKEFETRDVEAFQTLERAACQVVRLSGDYSDDETQEQAYGQARDLLLQNSDLLIAIYDPTVKGGRAGTAETVRHAMDSNTPVIAVLLHGGEVRIAVYLRQRDLARRAGQQWTNASTVDNTAWSTKIFDCVSQQLVLRDDEALRRLRMLRGEETLPFLCGHSKLFSSLWEALLSFARLTADPHEEPKEPVEWVKTDITLQPYARFQKRAEELSSLAMNTYRGAFVISYVLAACAVTSAVSMLAAALYFHAHVPMPLMLTLCAVKVAILVFLLLLEWKSRVGRYQQIAADFRYLAELLRPMQWLVPVGAYPPSVELPLHAAAQDPRRSWMTWLARAVARSTPSVVTTPEKREVFLDADAAADALDAAQKQWIAGQAKYHANRARDMHDLESGLEHHANWCLYAVIAFAVLACIAETVLHWETHAIVMGALAAILPAFIATFHGLAFQSEAKRLTARYDAMHEALVAQYKQIGQDVEELRSTKPADAVGRVTKVLRDISAETIREAGDWKVFYPVHAIHSG